MPRYQDINGGFALAGYPGDAKVMLAFNLKSKPDNLAGFTIQVTPPGKQPYFLWNDLQFKDPSAHAQLQGEPAYSTANAPIHKFRWVHVPGLDHQGLEPPYGDYTYTVTPRYFDGNQHMTALEPAQSAKVTVLLQPFDEGAVNLGFTRGFVQSQAFVHHFGPKLPTRPTNGPLNYDTSKQAGKDPQGKPYTYEQQYQWLGFTARSRVFDLLNAVDKAADAKIDVFCYDLNEPDVVRLLLKLGEAGKVRIILDNADLHHDAADPKPEDEFEQLFIKAAGRDAIKRGRFGRYAHDKVFVVYKGGKAQSVLTGSTNFSVTGLYVNANHVVVFDSPDVAHLYAGLFQEAWDDDVKAPKFTASNFANRTFSFPNKDGVPAFDVTFSPRPQDAAAARLDEIVKRCDSEAEKGGNVFFAVMTTTSTSPNPVYEKLTALHEDTRLFSYGISDNPSGIAFYPVGEKHGVLVTGKPKYTQLPPPFDQVPNILSAEAHQIHHKFVVCGFGGHDPVVYCGSSNLALAAEHVNGDNLLCIHDDKIVTAFTIEAVLLIDHFNFLDQTAKAPKGKGAEAKTEEPPADKRAAAVQAEWFLGTDGKWADKYFDPKDLHSRDREMFAAGPAME